MSMNVAGMDEAKRRFAELAQKCGNAHVVRVVEPALRLGMLDVLRAAQSGGRIPRAKGTMARSGAVRMNATTGHKTGGGVEFGGMSSAYASVQHERTDFNHTLPAGKSRTHRLDGKKRKHPILGYRGGGAKWLYGTPESAWEQKRLSVHARISKAVVDEIQKKGK